MLKWYDKKGKNSDVVLSSRIRLAEEYDRVSVFNQDKCR